MSANHDRLGRHGVKGGPAACRHEWGLDVDPRTWPEFIRHVMREGKMMIDLEFANRTSDLKTRKQLSLPESYKREPSVFADWIEPFGTPNAKFVAEPGRYHLFTSGVCPWASGVRAVRRILELEDVISMDIADGQSDLNWVFLDGTTCTSFPGRKGSPFYLWEVYSAAHNEASTRVTVPVLWDTKLRKIVSNDSWSIIKMLATSFRPLSPARAPRDMYPMSLARIIDDLHAEYYDGLTNGVYKAGITLVYGNEAGHASAAKVVYDTLDRIEKVLSTQPFLTGPLLTILDIRVVVCVLRFDAAYYDAFALRGAGHVFGPDGDTSFPHLRDYTRAVYSVISDTVEWKAFPQYFRWTVGHPRDSRLPDLAVIKASAETTASESRIANLYRSSSNL